VAQRPVELAFADPQPHFVAAWAPKKPREAERSAVLVQRVSLDLADVPLDLALKSLIQRAGLNITYSPAVLPKGKRVTIEAGDIAVITALTEMLFKSGLDVMVDRDGAMALVVCRHPAPRAEIPDSGTIVGTVTDRATGAPIAGATVVVEGTSLSATTDGEGHYRIEGVRSGPHTVRARYIGYAPIAVQVVVPDGGEVAADLAVSKSAQKLDELVTVTPGGMQTELRAVPTPVTVITADDIQQQRPLALLETIRQAVPGAVAFFGPSRPEATGFSVRGASSLSGLGGMKVLVDGVEASTFGESPVDPSSIERIEVIRGPQAATLYGSDAAGGVVQIFTKRGSTGLARPSVDLEAQGGIAQTPYEDRGGVLRQHYGASMAGGASDVTYNLGATYTRLADWLPGDERSRQSIPSVYGGIQYARGVAALDIHGRYLRSAVPAVLNPLLMVTGFVPFARPPYADQNVTNETYGTRLAVLPTTWWRNQLTLGVDRTAIDNVQYRRRLTTPDDTLFQIFTESERKLSVGYNASVSGSFNTTSRVTLVLGVDHYRTDATSFFTAQALNTEGTIETSPAGALTESRSLAKNTGYFAQAEVGWRETVFLTAGLRAEENSAFGRDLGTPVSPRIGLALARDFGSTTIKLRGAYGKAIRAPSPGRSTGSVTASQIILANSLLSPEEQFGWDAGVDVVFGARGTLSVSGYDQTAKNLISFQQVADLPLPTFQFQNIGRVANSGIEIEGQLSLRSATLTARYAYTRSRVEDLGPGAPGAEIQVGDRPLGLPTHTAGAALTVTPVAGTTLTAGLTYVGKFRQADILALARCFGGTGPCPSTFNVEYPGFVKLNLAITQQLSREVDGFIAINNLTNKEVYEGSNSIPVMGRTTMVGAHLHY
jgi:outer membrane receptor protein involved in Fe transport